VRGGGGGQWEERRGRREWEKGEAGTKGGMRGGGKERGESERTGKKENDAVYF